MLQFPCSLPKPNSITLSRFNLSPFNTHPISLPFSHIKPPKNLTPSFKHPLIGYSRQNNTSHSITNSHADQITNDKCIRKNQPQNNFWGAVTLIIGTAVGPGMLGLPAATIRSGSFPSTITISLCWVYVIFSIVLVAELSFAAMEEDGVEEVSFTGLATKSLGTHFGAVVAVVYASLSFSLLIACASGIGSIVSQWFPRMNLVLAHTLFPLAAGIVIVFFPFKVVDTVNRFLCLLMVLSISSLVGIGLSVARTNVLGSFAHSSWSFSSILPAVPVTVLTLGFHVITPFICKMVGNSASEARKAILIGGAVPLMMVLSWNLIVLGLSGVKTTASVNDPISLLLSVNPSALSAVQGFAFSALATSLIGYAVSFPKQLIDTLDLVLTKNEQIGSEHRGSGRVGRVVFTAGHDCGKPGSALFDRSKKFDNLSSSMAGSNSYQRSMVTMLVLGVPILIGSLFPSTFSRALEFAGVYANCFLFGILPPVMAYVQQSRKKLRSSILPGGDMTLLLLFGIAVILAIWH
ncbi:uncharacterized protein [Euphorbia lathyris]|uniref:uncharacterized protein n=1 Tax=Euphorbia lathyris TaxID=212925 RepID=UPI0033134554